MQQAAFDHYGLAVRYEAWETPPSELPARLAGLHAPEVLGSNVTVPHKQAVMAAMAEIEREAAAVGAVNTIVNREGRLLGYNTDVAGCLRALREEADCRPRGRRALLLGAGGAARAVAYGLLREGVRSLAIANRSADRARTLAREMASLWASAPVRVVAWQEAALAAAARESDVIVNATTLGMWHGPAEGETPLAAEAIPAGAAVLDLVYNPPDTPLLQAARAAGATAINGLPMLVYQGAESFRLWTGLEAPVEAMRAAAAGALSVQRGRERA